MVGGGLGAEIFGIVTPAIVGVGARGDVEGAAATEFDVAGPAVGLVDKAEETGVAALRAGVVPVPPAPTCRS